MLLERFIFESVWVLKGQGLQSRLGHLLAGSGTYLTIQELMGLTGLRGYLCIRKHAYLQHRLLSNFTYTYIGKAEIYFYICLHPFYIFTVCVYGALPLRPGEVGA